MLRTLISISMSCHILITLQCTKTLWFSHRFPQIHKNQKKKKKKPQTSQNHKNKVSETHVLKAEIKETVTTKGPWRVFFGGRKIRRKEIQRKKSWKSLTTQDRRKRKGKREKYMKFAAKLTVGTELDVDALVEAESDEIQRLLHCALFFARHFSSSSLQSTTTIPLKPLITFKFQVHPLMYLFVY